MDSDIMVVGVVSDDPFAIDVAHYLGQRAEISDILAYKSFANSEFCPRFISDENDFGHIGAGLENHTVVMVATCCGGHTRNAMAMRTCLVARAARDNGARRVILIEPDLYYSAQDRGPRPEHGKIGQQRSRADYKKFDGQPFSSLLHAELMRASGVDTVITVHNHSVSVRDLYARLFPGCFFNLSPAELYAHYLSTHGATFPDARDLGLILCAPDEGATPFVREVHAVLEKLSAHMLLKRRARLLLMTKDRAGERQVSVSAAADSPLQLKDVAGQHVVVFDDMVRTGSTIVQCCRLLKESGARHVMFVVTHFYSSEEVKEKLNDKAIDEIVTTNTLPAILNRDMQGRLRRKMLVLKIEKWIVNFLRRQLQPETAFEYRPPYSLDVSSKNPRWRPGNGDGA